MNEIESLDVYKIAMHIGESIWNIVLKWEPFPRIHLGGQLVEAADSIANNISEGYGRFHFKENKQFCYYARGSLFETFTELTKAKQRDLIDESEYQLILDEINILKPKLNAYINSIGKTGS
jgi:four helix bundle protein